MYFGVTKIVALNRFELKGRTITQKADKVSLMG